MWSVTLAAMELHAQLARLGFRPNVQIVKPKLWKKDRVKNCTRLWSPEMTPAIPFYKMIPVQRVILIAERSVEPGASWPREKLEPSASGFALRATTGQDAPTSR